MRSYVYECKDCGFRFTAIVNYDDRETQPCEECGSAAERTWSGWTMNVSTRNSASMPAVTSKGRFSNLRNKQELVKEKSKARENGDRDSEKRLSKEIKKL